MKKIIGSRVSTVARAVAISGAIISGAILLSGCGGSSSSRSAATPVPIDDNACLWFGPYSRDNPVSNIAYPDDGATYWSARFTLPEGAELKLNGEFPYARYMSLTSYRATTEPAFTLTDRDIEAATGSENPFRTGAARLSEQRAYSVNLVAGARPAQAAPNTVYLEANEGQQAVMVYRVYVANQGLPRDGGVDLPQPELTLANGDVLTGTAACKALAVDQRVLDIPLMPESIYVPARSNFNPAMDPPVFRAAYNLEINMGCSFGGACNYTTPQQKAVRYYALLDNQYVYAYLDRSIKPLVVLDGRLPKVPLTMKADETFDDRDADLRYWSLCQNQNYSQKVEACLHDEQLVLLDEGTREYVIVTAHEADRPANARPECGVNFLAWSEEGDGLSILEGRANNANDGFLIMRNMLPSANFDHAVQRTEIPGDEKQVMGPYLPNAKYFDKAEFEALGCPVS